MHKYVSKSNEVLSELMTRLPELEWKISALGTSFPVHSLPRGLFRSIPNGIACIAEIKADMESLSRREHEFSSLYLAQRIQQKINVLVTVCQIHKRKNHPEETPSFGLTTLTTRQQWIRGLEMNILSLEKQQQAMTNTLEHMLRQQNSVVILDLQAELGKVECKLTLAKETLNRAIS